MTSTADFAKGPLGEARINTLGGVRDAFPEFYRPTRKDERDFITRGTVVVDANVLLALYELSAIQRNETLVVLETIGSRLWIPYQVGLEYQRNRLGVIRKQASHYTHLVDLHGVRDLDGLTGALAGLAVPDEVADEVRPLLDNLAQRLSEATAEYVSAAEEIRRRHVVTAEQGLNDDPVRQRLDALFSGRVGQRPDDKTHENRISKATQRREKQIPPGYKDDKKPTDERSAGDYLLWAELLEHAEATASDGRPFLLVTNDVKDDWYAKSGGEPTGPRPELVREFHACNSNGYHQVTLEGMLRLAREHLSVHVDDATIEKASELSRPDLFYADDRRYIIQAKRHSEPSRRAALDRRMRLELLVDTIMQELLEDLPETDASDARGRLTRTLLREVHEVAVARGRSTLTDEGLWAHALQTLRRALGYLSGEHTWSEETLVRATNLFVNLVQSYRHFEMPHPEEDR